MQPHKTAPASPSGKISPTQGHVQGKGDAQSVIWTFPPGLVAQVFIFSYFPKTAPSGKAGSSSVESKKG